MMVGNLSEETVCRSLMGTVALGSALLTLAHPNLEFRHRCRAFCPSENTDSAPWSRCNKPTCSFIRT